MAIAAKARIASPFQSRFNTYPLAPRTAINAERIALAAGAITQSAISAAIATGAARQRSSRMNNPAIHATTHPSTARLNPDIAKM